MVFAFRPTNFHVQTRCQMFCCVLLYPFNMLLSLTCTPGNTHNRAYSLEIGEAAKQVRLSSGLSGKLHYFLLWHRWIVLWCVCARLCVREREQGDGSWAKCLLAGEPVVDRWCLWEKLAPCRVSPQENAHANADRPTVRTHTYSHTHVLYLYIHRGVAHRHRVWVDYNLFNLCCSQPVHNTTRWDRPQRERDTKTVKREKYNQGDLLTPLCL